MSAPPIIFDRALLRKRRERAAPRFAEFDFVANAAAEESQARLEALLPAPVETAMVTGFRAPPDMQRLAREIVRADLAALPGASAVDEERQNLASASLDLYVSTLTLHTVNDVPGALIQIRRALKPGGRFMAALFGPRTLQELRAALSDAELEIEGGMSPRVHPFIDVRDAGALLQRAGFDEPVADTFDLPVLYKTPTRLLHDLRGMGETNILAQRRKGPLRRATLARAMAIYAQHYAVDGGVGATFELLFMSGKARGA